MRVTELVEHSVESGGRNAEVARGVDEPCAGMCADVSQIRQTTTVREGMDDLEEFGEASGRWSCRLRDSLE